MHILVEPGLGKNSSYLEEMFATLPNALLEWRTQDNVISKLPESNTTAAFLMDKIVCPENHPDDDFDEPLRMEHIIELTGLKKEDIWAIYRDYNAAGLMPKVLDFHYGRIDTEEERHAKAEQRRQLAIDKINATDLLLFDRYAHNRTMAAHERVSLQVLCDAVNSEYNTTYNPSNVNHLFDKIEKLGLREKRPPLNTCKRTIYSYKVYDLGFVLIKEYLHLLRKKEESGQGFSSKRAVFDELVALHPQYSRGGLLDYFHLAVLYVQHMDPEWELPAAPIGVSPADMVPADIAPIDKKQLPTSHELVNIAVECACEDYLTFCESDAYTEAADDEFLHVLLDKYNIRHININTFRARLLHWAQTHSTPSPSEAQTIGRVYGITVPESAIKTLRAYDRIVQEYRDSGQKRPPMDTLIAEIQKEVPLAPWTLKKNLTLARTYQRLVHPEKYVSNEDDKRPAVINQYRFRKGPRAFGRLVPAEAFKTMAVYESVVQEYRENKIGAPPQWILLEEIQEEIPLETPTLRHHISVVRTYRAEGADDISDVHLRVSEDVCELMFKAYAQYRQTHCKEIDAELAFIAELVEQHNVDVPPYVMKQYLLAMSNCKNHTSLPRFLPKSQYVPPTSRKAYKAWEEYEKIVQEYKAAGKNIPPDRQRRCLWWKQTFSHRLYTGNAEHLCACLSC